MPYLVDIYCVSGNLTYFAPISSSGIGQWTNSTPYPGKASSCVADSGYIYCISHGDPYATTWPTYYAALSEQGIGNWTESTPAPTPATPCVSSSGYIYCIGAGLEGFYAPISNSGVGSWKMEHTVQPPDTSTCTATSGDIYCIGAEHYVTLSNSTYYASLSSDGMGNATKTTDYPFAVASEPCAVYGGFVYCVAGHTGLAPYDVSGDDTSAVYFAPVSGSGIGAWKQTASYPVVGYGVSCVASSGYLYCLGGRNTGGEPLNDAYFSEITNSTPTNTNTGTNTGPTSTSPASSASGSANSTTIYELTGVAAVIIVAVLVFAFLRRRPPVSSRRNEAHN